MKVLKVRKGLNIPLGSFPKEDVEEMSFSPLIGVDFSAFSHIRMKVLVAIGDSVKIGQPLAMEKTGENRVFPSYASGKVQQIIRGEKRALKTIIIERSEKKEYFSYPTLSHRNSKEEVIEALYNLGLLSRILMRPFNVLASKKRLPNRIFIKAIESSPYTPEAEMQIKGKEEDFQLGISFLKLISQNVHLVYRSNSECEIFKNNSSVQSHPIKGPHPAGLSSVHIHHIQPIRNKEDIVWCLNVLDVICLGKALAKGQYDNDQVISIAGPGIKPEKVGFFRCDMGISISFALNDRLTDDSHRIISGDPLMGKQKEREEFLGFRDTVLCSFKENVQREFLHFFRLGRSKYSATKAYFSGFFPKKSYEFTTNQHGEERAFIDGSIYERVMSMRIPTMELIKAVLAEDFLTAETLGLLEVAPEDFALPGFICPSKIPMSEIIEHGLRKYMEEIVF